MGGTFGETGEGIGEWRKLSGVFGGGIKDARSLNHPDSEGGVPDVPNNWASARAQLKRCCPVFGPAIANQFGRKWHRL